MDNFQLWLRFERILKRFSSQNDSPVGYKWFWLHGHGRCLDIFTHLTKEEKLFLYVIARSMPKNSCIVELGSYLGASSCCLAAAASETGGRVFCVDSWQNEGMSEGLRDTYQEFLRNTECYRKWIVPLRGKSVQVSNSFTYGIDMIFVDADHSYEAVAADLRAWLPKLNPGGWLLMHDWGWAEGVKKAVQEYVKPIAIGSPEILPNMYAVRVDPTIR